MFRQNWLIVLLLAVVAVTMTMVKTGSARHFALPNLFPFPNTSGLVQTFSTSGDVDFTGPFFQSLGTNGGPILRALASRAPYFHNGSAATLADAVTFYNIRFNLNLSKQDQDDLVAFLKTL